MKILIFCLSLLVSTAQAATYYVDKLLPGSDSNNGLSEASPYLTINKCVTTLVTRKTPGDTCLVKNGTYAEHVWLTVPAGTAVAGTANSPITLKNFPGHAPVIDCSSFGSGDCVRLNSSPSATTTLSYFVFQGFEVTGSTTDALSFFSADHITIRNNYIHNNSNSGDPLNAGSGIFGRGYAITIDSNYSSRNGPTNSGHGAGMYLIGQGYLVINNLVSGNEGTGIQCAGYAFNATTMPNANHSGCSGTFANNVTAYNKNGSGFTLWNRDGATMNDTIQNNIIYENKSAGIGINYANSVTLTAQNNAHYATGSNQASFTLVAGVALPNPCMNCSSCTSCTITANSVSTNPNMTNAPSTLPSSPDFHLTDISAVAIGQALDLSASFTTDYAGTTRVVPWDVGAYEFGSDTTPPAAPTGLVVQ